MSTFLIVNGVLLVLMLGALIWVRAVERRQKAAKAAAAAQRRREPESNSGIEPLEKRDEAP